MATESKSDAINGDEMTTKFAFGDAKYGYGMATVYGMNP